MNNMNEIETGKEQHMKQPVMKTFSIVLVLLVLVTGNAVAGGENRVGTSAASELLIPVGARDIAMGGSSIATSTGLEAIFWNPAGLARSTHAANAMFSHMQYIADIGVDYVGVSGTFEGFGTLGLTVKSLSIGNIGVTTEDQPDGTGQLLSPTVAVVGMTYSRLLTDRISIGTTINIISERFDRVSATGFAVNAGVQYSGLGGVRGLSLGVAVKNIGPQLTFDGDGLLRQGNVNDVLRPGSFYKVQAASHELPSTIEIGLAYSTTLAEQSSLELSSVFQNNNFATDEYKVGLEYGFNNLFFLRGGYGFAESSESASSPLPDKKTHIFGLTAGAGIHHDLGGLDLTFDYAFRDVEFLDSNHIFSLKVGF